MRDARVSTGTVRVARHGESRITRKLSEKIAIGEPIESLLTTVEQCAKILAMSNTSRSVSSQHEHRFNAQGVCNCGKTIEQYQAEESAKNTPQEAAPAPETPETPNAQEPAETEE